MQIDRIDRAILRALADDARAPVTRVADQCGLSQSACSRRIAALEAVGAIPGVVGCALVSGQQDYRLTILARDLDDYERLHREHLGRLPGVTTINSSFVLREVPTLGEAEAMLG